MKLSLPSGSIFNLQHLQISQTCKLEFAQFPFIKNSGLILPKLYNLHDILNGIACLHGQPYALIILQISLQIATRYLI